MEERAHFAFGGVERQGDDLGARTHDVANPFRAELQHPGEHPGSRLVMHPALARLTHDSLQLIVGRVVFDCGPGRQSHQGAQTCLDEPQPLSDTPCFHENADSSRDLNKNPQGGRVSRAMADCNSCLNPIILALCKKPTAACAFSPTQIPRRSRRCSTRATCCAGSTPSGCRSRALSSSPMPTFAQNPSFPSPPLRSRSPRHSPWHRSRTAEYTNARSAGRFCTCRASSIYSWLPPLSTSPRQPARRES